MTSDLVPDLLRACRTVDAFVGPDARGNPAGVLVLQTPIGEQTMQDIARAMGHAETAFLHETENGVYALRWFTPEAEVALCGHATLASAWSLWNQNAIRADPLSFDTQSGRLSATRVGNKVELDFPQDAAKPWIPPRALLSALGVHRFVAAGLSPTSRKIILELGSAQEVASLRPEPAALLEAVPGSGGVVVTARDAPPFDFVSRFFHPWVGIDEDPVTGSAHCLLATYWSRVLGQNMFHARQASERGGVLEVELVAGRVKLRGEARGRDAIDEEVVARARSRVNA